MILAFETATNVCSVAFKDRGGEVYEKRIAKRGSHSEKLFLFVEKLMKEHDFLIPDLEAVLVSEGPGSYTGLRIAASAVKGLLFQTDVSLYGVNTLASFAMQAATEYPRAKTIHSIIDARRVHVYHQQFVFDSGSLRADSEVKVIPIERFEAKVNEQDVIIGSGLKRLNEDLKSNIRNLGPDFITAKSLISLFNDELDAFYKQVDPGTFDPEYYTSNQVE